MKKNLCKYVIFYVLTFRIEVFPIYFGFTVLLLIDILLGDSLFDIFINFMTVQRSKNGTTVYQHDKFMDFPENIAMLLGKNKLDKKVRAEK